jgi:hypothetical protein
MHWLRGCGQREALFVSNRRRPGAVALITVSTSPALSTSCRAGNTAYSA